MPGRIRALSEAMGAELSGADLSAGDGTEVCRQVLGALVDRQVVVIRDQKLTPAAFARFAARFGRPQPHVLDHLRHPDFPEILPLSNVIEKGEPTGVYDGAAYWHTDMSYETDPAFATLVYSIKAPQSGGETRFANMAGAYDALSDRLKARIEDLTVVHRYGNRASPEPSSRTGASPLNQDQAGRVEDVLQPLVKRHPISGRKALYAVAGSSMGIEGWPHNEGVALLDELTAHATQSTFTYTHRYAVGDVVVWDNFATLHAATLIPPATGPGDTRLLHRISVKRNPSIPLQ